MLFGEIRRIYFRIFSFLIFATIIWLFFGAIRPEMGQDLYEDYHEYEYYKPLSKKEFIYFHLTKDLEKNKTTVFITDSWVPTSVTLTEEQRTYMYNIVQKLNPNYTEYQKMSEVKLQLEYKELLPLLKNLEVLLGENSFYYTCFEEPVYGTYAFYRYQEDDFKKHEKNFLLTYKDGISDAYARIGADAMGCFLGFLSIIFSFRIFSEEKKYQMESYIFTSNVSSARYILMKYFSILLPIAIFSFILTLLEYFCFLYWNFHYEYGYSIEFLSFFKSTIFIVLPSIALIISLSLVLGILFSNQLYTIICQFILYYFSISSTLEKKHGFSFIVRYGDYDDYLSYEKYRSMILLNRFSVIFITILFLIVTIHLFCKKRRGSDAVFFVRNINLLKKQTWQKSHGIAYYLFRQVIGWNVIIYFVYAGIMLLVTSTPKMTAGDIAVIGENILIFASFFLFVKIANYDYSLGVDGFINTIIYNPIAVGILRLIFASFILFLFVEIPLIGLCVLNGVSIGRWCLGVYISTLGIGLCSLLITEVSGDRLIGYFFFISYYLFNVIAGEAFPLTLLGYTCRVNNTKYFLCCFIVIQLIMYIFLCSIKVKGIGLKRYENRD